MTDERELSSQILLKTKIPPNAMQAAEGTVATADCGPWAAGAHTVGTGAQPQVDGSHAQRGIQRPAQARRQPALRCRVAVSLVSQPKHIMHKSERNGCSIAGLVEVGMCVHRMVARDIGQHNKQMGVSIRPSRSLTRGKPD